MAGRSSPSSLTFVKQTKAARPGFASTPRSVGGALLLALFSDRKTEAQSPDVGTKEEKKESKRPPKRLPEVMHDPLRVPQAAPFLRQPSPTSCLRYGNGLPALLSDSFLQSTLENAVYLWLPSHSVSPLHVLEGLQVPEGCAKTTAVSGGCGLDNETEEPAGGAEG